MFKKKTKTFLNYALDLAKKQLNAYLKSEGMKNFDYYVKNREINPEEHSNVLLLFQKKLNYIFQDLVRDVIEDLRGSK